MTSTEERNAQLNNSLPIVSADTIDAVFHVYAGKKWGKHLDEVRVRMLQENPQLVKFIESQVGKYPHTLHTALFEVVLGTISVLEHQAMIDNKKQSEV